MRLLLWICRFSVLITNSWYSNGIFEFGTQPKTVITREYPQAWQPGLEPFYPVNTRENDRRYQQYYVRTAKKRLVNIITNSYFPVFRIATP